MKQFRVAHPLIVIVVSVALAQLACGSSAPTAAAQQSATTAAQPAATASERGSSDEAKAMLRLAVEHYQTVGRDQALADFNAGQPPFMDRDLYVVCLGADHVELANGGFPSAVGASPDGLQDVEGRPLGQAMWDELASSDEGSIRYDWLNPVSGETEPKILFIHKLDDVLCGVGAYNPG